MAEALAHLRGARATVERLLANGNRSRSSNERLADAGRSIQIAFAALAAEAASPLQEVSCDSTDMSLARETTYTSLFVQGRGVLRQEIYRCMREGGAVRRAKEGNLADDTWRIKNMAVITGEPPAIEDCALPGSWEGDLISGRGTCAVGTLIESSTRYVILFRLPDGRTAQMVRAALAKRIVTLPTQLRRSVEWDQGLEMSERLRFAVDTDVQVYFCDPRSSWRRLSRETTMEVLGQHFPKSKKLADFSQGELNAIAGELNGRPRRTLGGQSPSEAFGKAVADALLRDRPDQTLESGGRQSRLHAEG